MKCSSSAGEADWEISELEILPVQHYSGVTWASWRLKSPRTLLFFQHLAHVSKRESTNLGITDPLSPMDSSHKGPVIRGEFYYVAIWCSMMCISTTEVDLERCQLEILSLGHFPRDSAYWIDDLVPFPNPPLDIAKDFLGGHREFHSLNSMLGVHIPFVLGQYFTARLQIWANNSQFTIHCLLLTDGTRKTDAQGGCT